MKPLPVKDKVWAVSFCPDIWVVLVMVYTKFCCIQTLQLVKIDHAKLKILCQNALCQASLPLYIETLYFTIKDLASYPILDLLGVKERKVVHWYQPRYIT